MKPLYSLLELKTPCYIFYEDRFAASVHELNDSLSKHFTHGCIAVSVKTNSSDVYLRKAASLGCMAEVVSEYEYALALRCGFNPEKIVYNGPYKSYESFSFALNNKSIVNIETHREIEWLEKISSSDKQYNVGLRINIDLDDVDKEESSVSRPHSRFGFFHKSGELQDAINRLKRLHNVKIAGLSAHRTTRHRNPKTYRNITDYLLNLVSFYNLQPLYFDLGGGYSGMLPDSPKWEEYVNAIYAAIKDSDYKIDKLIMEPGSALAASSFDFLCECIDVHSRDKNTRICTTDASKNDVDPFFRKEGFFYRIISKAESESIPIQLVAGFTCLEDDILLRLEHSPSLHIGDRILFMRTGAYTLTLTPSFIRPAFCNIYTYSDGYYILSRKADTILHE